jgi:hypothetical protein
MALSSLQLNVRQFPGRDVALWPQTNEPIWRCPFTGGNQADGQTDAIDRFRHPEPQ